MKYSILIFVLLFVFAGAVLANGFGMTVDKVVGEYTANVDYDAVNGIFVGAPVQFAFQLFTNNRAQMVDFSDAWVTISPSGSDASYVPPVFDGGILGSNSGLVPSGMTFTFPKGGDYDMKIRYDKDGKTIVEATFQLKVIGGSGENAGSNSGFLKGLLAGLVGVAIIAGVVFMSKRKKATY